MLYVWKMWNAKVLPCVDALGYWALASPGVSVWQREWFGKSLCQASRKGFVLFYSCPSSPPFLCPFYFFSFFFFIHLLEALLFIGWQCLKNRIWWDVMEEEDSAFHGILWQEPCLLREYVDSKYFRKFSGSVFSSTTFWHVCRGSLVTSHYINLLYKHCDHVNLSFPIFY